MEKMGPSKAEEKKEEETGTSLFHQLLAQRKDLGEEAVCVQFNMDIKHKCFLLNVQYAICQTISAVDVEILL